MAVTSEGVSRFWIEEVGEERWYVQEAALDDEIRARFLSVWEAALAGDLYDWCESAVGVFGFLILTDQMPRNMFRDDARAFATDALARMAAKRAIQRGWDLQIEEPGRQFFYLPLEHSERMADQETCVRLMDERMPLGREAAVLHAKVHREIIRRFGRFPYRNAALGRVSSAEEQAFLAGDGYRGVLKQVQSEG